MSTLLDRFLRYRPAYRVASLGIIGYPLIFLWDQHWLPRPQGEATALLRDRRFLKCQLKDRTQRTMYLGLFEPSETRLIGELLTSGDTFVDIGAHVGWFTTIASKRVGQGTVLAVEPYASNAMLLKENLARNHCSNVQLVETALGSEPGVITLRRTFGDSGAVTALPWAHDEAVEVPIATLDVVAADLPSVKLMKIDVEGWEAHVLRGGMSTLSRTDYVLIEINNPALREAGTSKDEIIGLLRDAGFANFSIVVERGLRRFVPTSVTNVLASKPTEVGNPRAGTTSGMSRSTARHLHVDSGPTSATHPMRDAWSAPTLGTGRAGSSTLLALLIDIGSTGNSKCRCRPMPDTHFE